MPIVNISNRSIYCLLRYVILNLIERRHLYFHRLLKIQASIIENIDQDLISSQELIKAASAFGFF